MAGDRDDPCYTNRDNTQFSPQQYTIESKAFQASYERKTFVSDAHFKTIGRRISSSMSRPSLMFSVISITVSSPFQATYDHND